MKEYNSSVISKAFKDNISYYLVIGNKAFPVKKEKRSILSALGNKQTELEAFIKANNLNLKNDDDLARLINYYNSI
jgi:hypothetical protein